MPPCCARSVMPGHMDPLRLAEGDGWECRDCVSGPSRAHAETEIHLLAMV